MIQLLLYVFASYSVNNICTYSTPHVCHNVNVDPSMESSLVVPATFEKQDLCLAPKN
jgi:hypothetical protein